MLANRNFPASHSTLQCTDSRPGVVLSKAVRRQQRLAYTGHAAANRHHRESSEKSRGFYKVLIADDHPIVREGLSAIINQQPDMKVVAEARNGEDAVSKFFSVRPDVALLDLRMPIMDGEEVVGE